MSLREANDASTWAGREGREGGKEGGDGCNESA